MLHNYTGSEHGLCNVHHLLELQGAIEAGHTRPMAMSCLLLDTETLVAGAISGGQDRLGARAVRELADSYRVVIEMGHDEHPATTAKRTKAHNLLIRLERCQPHVLRLAHDFTRPVLE